MVLLNSFSIGMLVPHAEGEVTTISFHRVSLDFARTLVTQYEYPTAAYPNGRTTVDSAIGHENTARILKDLLKVDDLPVRRVSVMIGVEAVVAQYVGPRLPEGATTLPDGADIQWFLVRVLDDVLVDKPVRKTTVQDGEY